VTRSEAIFHLAVVSGDLDQSEDFYTRLGCTRARRYGDRITLNFFDHQVVCHLEPSSVDPEPKMYPRHFGMTFTNESDYESVLDGALMEGLPFFAEDSWRWQGRADQHRTFFLRDPSNNLLEFKWYPDSTMIY
jgi:extradiol dioxygenase family protein